ncbi:MAG TPA: TIGR03435 family protein [Terracidiphilus sp.]|nr:TIGR03435 family protein [Terracidiphilus sp.]
MLLIKRFVVCLLVTASAFAQAQSFATIDVKPARSVDPQPNRVRVLLNGDLIGTSVNAITLISEGYSVPANPSERLSTLPPWVYSERYDIEAKAPSSAGQLNPSDGNTSKLVRDMFRQVLADRFHLVMRTEYRTIPVYALVTARGGAKLQQSNLSRCILDTARDGCHSFLIGFGHPLNARAVDMDDLARYIENWTDLPAINRTSLIGVFTITTEGWRPMRLPPPPPNCAGNMDFTHLQTIGTALSGLGLELHKEVATLPVYTVEQIQRPSVHQEQ